MNEDNEHRKVCFGIRTVHTPWGESAEKSLSQPSQTQTWAVQVPLLERRDLLRMGWGRGAAAGTSGANTDLRDST